jgi:hypothetical protein
MEYVSPTRGNPVTGAIRVDINTINTTSVTSVSGSATNVNLLVDNPNRKFITVYNNCDKNLYLKLGATASLTSFTVLMVPSGYYELPLPIYTGVIDGIWDDNPTGFVTLTEML